MNEKILVENVKNVVVLKVDAQGIKIDLEVDVSKATPAAVAATMLALTQHLELLHAAINTRKGELVSGDPSQN